MEQICPKCGAAIPVTEGYPVWCDKCDWGVKLNERPRKTNIFTKAYDKLSKQQAEGIYKDVIKNNVKPLVLPPATLLAYAIALAVTLITLLFVAFSIYIVGFTVVEWSSGRTPPTACLGIMMLPLLLGLAWFLRPELGRMPRIYLSRAEAPNLYSLSDRIADELKAKHIEAIVLSPIYNAGYKQVGVFRRPVMTLGLPLLIASSPQEIVACISHEIAHGVNGDPNRTLLLGGAIQSLKRWYFLLSPEGAIRIPIFGLIVAAIMYVISSVPRLLALALTHLTYPTMQRSEYYADALGAKVSGAEFAISSLRKTELADNFYQVAKRTWDRRRARPLSVWNEFRDYLVALPAREYERFIHAQSKLEMRLDDSHPPTHFRVLALQGSPDRHLAPKIVLSPEEYNKIIAETNPFEKQLEIALMND